MENIETQKKLQITDKSGSGQGIPEFITEDVVEVKKARLIYYKWICRLMMLLAVGTFSLSIAFCLSIMKLIPSIIVDAQIFVVTSDSGSIIKREFVEPQMESREKMMVNFVKQYVELRNTYIKDKLEMNKRWLWGGLVAYLSTYKVYQEFAKDVPHMQEEMAEDGSSRSVEILSVQRTGGDKSNTWLVEFKTYDYKFEVNKRDTKNAVEPTIKEQYWSATVSGTADSGRRIAYRRLINPLGFIIYRYSQSDPIEG